MVALAYPDAELILDLRACVVILPTRRPFSAYDLLAALAYLPDGQEIKRDGVLAPLFALLAEKGLHPTTH